MNTKNIIKFYSKSKNFTELSNFYLQSFELDKNSFISGEHAFHYFKYKLMSVHSTDTRRQNELEMYSRKFVGLDPYFKSPLDAKKAGGKNGKALNDIEIIEWNTVSSNVQHNICKARVASSEDLSSILTHTSNQYLLHQENRGKSPIWGGRIDKITGELIGKNKLGKIWMKVRDEL